MTELLSCPFCGSHDVEVQGKPAILDALDSVCCNECSADAPYPVWNTRAQIPRQGGEAVEVVACIDLDTDAGVVLYANREPHLDAELLMTVAQHRRILAASVGSAEPVAWREHSVNYAKGEKCPETIETLQAAWDRDQELINDMRHEIARHKTRINRLEQRRPAGQVAEAVAWLTSDKRHLVFSGALDQSQYVEQGMTPLYTHPAALPVREAVAEGWQLLPVEPTKEMQLAALPHVNRMHTTRDIWVAMCAASIAAPSPSRE